MKYYIPTSSLNIDNILQAECISPVSFYGQRLTGYKSLEVIDELKHCNSIVLFNIPVEFTINDHNRYNFPVIIEINDDEQLCHIVRQCDEHVFLCNQTIWLTPYNCRLFFYDENAYRLTIINAAANKSIKYYKYYRIVSNTNGLTKVTFPQVPSNESNLQISREVYCDKIKGAMYALLLGHYSKRTPELARQIRIAQEIYNLTAAVKATPSTAEIFIQRLCLLLEEYKSVDEEENKNSKIFEENFDTELGRRFKFLKKGLILLLQNWGVWDYVRKHLSDRWGITWLPTVNIEAHHTEYDYQSINTVVNKRTKSALDKYNMSIGNANLDAISIVDDKLVVNGATYISFVANYIISQKITLDVLQSNPSGFYMDIMTGVVNLFKSTNGNNAWDKSEEKIYVNDLYTHINDRGTFFNLTSTSNLEFISIAAVILYSNSFKTLANTLKMNEVLDFSYSFILWGVLSGYCELNKEDLAKVLTMDNYAKVYKMMTSKAMTMDRFDDISQTVATINIEGCANDIQLFLSILKVALKPTDKVLSVLEKKMNSESSVSLSQQVGQVLQVKECKKCKAQCERARLVLELVAKKASPEAINIVYKLGLQKNKMNQVLSLLGIEIPETSQKKSLGRTKKMTSTSSYISSIFDIPLNDEGIENICNKTAVLFVDDKNVIKLIDNLEYLPTSIKEILIKEVLSFQKDYAVDGYYGKQNYSRMNDNTISHFINKCTYQNPKTGNSWLANTPENRIILEKLRMNLMQRYDN